MKIYEILTAICYKKLRDLKLVKMVGAYSNPILIPKIFTCINLTSKRKKKIESRKVAFERLLNSVHETHIVFENLPNINGDILQKAWGLNIGEDSI